MLSLDGNTALIELNQQLTLVKLNPDGGISTLTTAVARPAYAGLLKQGAWVSVGHHVFDLEHGRHVGTFASTDTPLALSLSGQGLYLTRPSTPTTVGAGPLRWVAAAKER